MPGDTEHFLAGAFEQGVVDSDGDRRSRRQQPIHDQVDQHQPYRVGAPAGRGEEPMRPRVMPDPFQASTEQHPAHRAPPGLGDQPHHQTAERGEGWDGETGPEDHQHISQRTRYRAIRKHRPIALTRVNQTPSMLPSFPPGPRTRATGVSRTITEQDHQKVRNTSDHDEPHKLHTCSSVTIQTPSPRSAQPLNSAFTTTSNSVSDSGD